MINQNGGVVLSINSLLANLDSPAKLIYGFVMIILIVYSSIIPNEYKLFADSLLGRIFGLGIVYGVIQSLGWVYGLLTAMAFLLLLNGVSRFNYGLKEGFTGGGSINEKKIIGKRWFVEKVLGENPKKIETDKVLTSAVQD